MPFDFEFFAVVFDSFAELVVVQLGSSVEDCSQERDPDEQAFAVVASFLVDCCFARIDLEWVPN
jgi:hypothetical protein